MWCINKFDLIWSLPSLYWRFPSSDWGLRQQLWCHFCPLLDVVHVLFPWSSPSFRIPVYYSFSNLAVMISAMVSPRMNIYVFKKENVFSTAWCRAVRLTYGCCLFCRSAAGTVCARGRVSQNASCSSPNAWRNILFSLNRSLRRPRVRIQRQTNDLISHQVRCIYRSSMWGPDMARYFGLR